MTGKGISNKYIFLPLFYFFSLSFGLILLCSHWAISGISGLNSSFASENHESEYNLNINLISDDELIVEINEDSENLIAEKINQFLSSHKTPLAGYGETFVREAEKNQIDPTIVAAIGWCESNAGKVTPQFGGQESYNAWGYAVYDNNEATKNHNAYSMGSWENGIAIMSRAIRKYYDRGLIEPEQIVTRYTPASVKKANGNPEQAPWTLCVKGAIEEILEG